MHMDQHMMDGNNQMMPQDGMGPNNNGQHMYQNCQNQMMPQDGMGQIMVNICIKMVKCLRKVKWGNKVNLTKCLMGTTKW